MQEFSKYFSKVSSYLKSFANSIKNIDIQNEDKSFIDYNLTLIYLLSQNFSSISILLKKNHYTSVASLLRITIESFFSLNWVTEANNEEEINEKIYRLEANPYRLYEIELEKMEDNLKTDKPIWKPEVLKMLRDSLEKQKKTNPFLTEIKNGKVVFKSAPSMAKRMENGNNRIGFYHLYSFTSFFSHPTPSLKILFELKDNSIDFNKIIKSPLAETIIQSLQFVIGILGNLEKMYSDFNGKEKRKIILNGVKNTTKNAIKVFKKKYKTSAHITSLISKKSIGTENK